MPTDRSYRPDHYVARADAKTAEGNRERLRAMAGQLSRTIARGSLDEETRRTLVGNLEALEWALDITDPADRHEPAEATA